METGLLGFSVKVFTWNLAMAALLFALILVLLEVLSGFGIDLSAAGMRSVDAIHPMSAQAQAPTETGTVY